MLLFIAALIATVVWGTGFLAFLIWHRRRVFLEDVIPTEPPRGWPGLTIVVAGRNEQEGVESALRSLLRVDYPALKIRAVNDRSSDRTGEIMDRVAQDDSRLEVLHVTELPSGWLGKNHALNRAIQGVQTDYVLFTDADVVLAPLALRKAVAFAERTSADLTVGYPDLVVSTIWERSFCVVFALAFALRFQNWMIEHPRLRTHLGIGAFNLIRRTALERIEGFEHLKLSVDDDVKLGEAVKVHGLRIRVGFGMNEIRVKWQENFSGYIRGFEKNAFASTGYRVSELIFGAAGCVLIFVVPWLALFAGGWTGSMGLVSLLLLFTLVHMGRRGLGAGIPYVLLTPFMAGALAWAMINSMIKTLRQDGVVWRDSRYPLAELRAHVRERTRWLDAAWKTTRHTK